MIQAPAVTYTGGVAGIPATKPAEGEKLDRASSAVTSYVGHLNSAHSQALAEVGGEKLYDYNIAFNGFAAKLTDGQAAAIAKVPGVLSVEADVVYHADTSTTPRYLGLDARNGIWEKLGGPSPGGITWQDGAGENIIIGVIDSGITPESLSFTDREILRNRQGNVVYRQVPIGPPPAGWAGTCQTGELWTASSCNNKLIGARYFNAGFGGNAGIDATRPWEFNSPRDYNGHGTHTAGTSGGNYRVPATGAAAAFGRVSGMAPRARVAMYKALWSTQDSSTASGTGVDLLAAIDTAVADGVDVINYSISGTTNNFLDGAEIAFLNATAAGVFVSASAGNSGPGASTVAHPSPWITTVAAETHDRVGAGSATIDGVVHAGASAGTGSATGTLVTFGTPASPARLCQLNTLTSAAAGKIVFCERGVNARVEKSFEVQRVGGIGMILVNPTANSLNADLHFVPSVHLQNDKYATIEAAALAGKTASITGQILFNQPAPFMAAFSSRGPLIAGAGDLLKPDIGAPGVDVLAAVAPPGQRGREFDLFSGTSMSAPHIAGIAALFKQLHPDWSPMAIKSALMTTATDVLETFTGTTASDASALRAFAQGAGHVQPNPAMTPGLVFDSNINDWLAFLCGATTGVLPSVCSSLSAAGYSFDRSDMNVPSIAIGDLAGVQTVKRKVTNVDDTAADVHRVVVDHRRRRQRVAGVVRDQPGRDEDDRGLVPRHDRGAQPLHRGVADAVELEPQRADPARRPARRVRCPGRGELERLAGELAGAGWLQRPAQRRCRRSRAGDRDAVHGQRGSGSDVRPDRPDRDVLDDRVRPGRSALPRRHLRGRGLAGRHRPRPVRLQRDGVAGEQCGR